MHPAELGDGVVAVFEEHAVVELLGALQPDRRVDGEVAGDVEIADELVEEQATQTLVGTRVPREQRALHHLGQVHQREHGPVEVREIRPEDGLFLVANSPPRTAWDGDGTTVRPSRLRGWPLRARRRYAPGATVDGRGVGRRPRRRRRASTGEPAGRPLISIGGPLRGRIRGCGRWVPVASRRAQRAPLAGRQGVHLHLDGRRRGDPGARGRRPAELAVGDDHRGRRTVEARVRPSTVTGRRIASRCSREPVGALPPSTTFTASVPSVRSRHGERDLGRRRPARPVRPTARARSESPGGSRTRGRGGAGARRGERGRHRRPEVGGRVGGWPHSSPGD